MEEQKNPLQDSLYSQEAEKLQHQFQTPLVELGLNKRKLPEIPGDSILDKLDWMRNHLVGLSVQLSPVDILKEESKISLDELVSRFDQLAYMYENALNVLSELRKSYGFYHNYIEKYRTDKMIQSAKFGYLVTLRNKAKYIRKKN